MAHKKASLRLLLRHYDDVFKRAEGRQEAAATLAVKTMKSLKSKVATSGLLYVADIASYVGASAGAP